MAFTQKSKFTSSGLMSRMPNKAKLINNSKTAFHQELPENFVATKTATKLDGTVVPVEGTVTETKQYENSRPFEVVYDEFDIDPVSGGRINSKTGKIYSNIDEFKDDAKKDSEVKTVYKGDYNRTEGTPDETIKSVKYPKNLYDVGQLYMKAKDLKGWKGYLAKRGIEQNEELTNYLVGVRKSRRRREIADQKRKDFSKKLKTCNNTNNNRDYCQEVQKQAARNREYNKNKKEQKYTRLGKKQSEEYIVPTAQN